MPCRTSRTALLAGVILLAASVAAADPRLPAVFGDHMVLQRDRPIPVWGLADPGEVVSVTLDGDSVQATAGPDGRWRVALPAHAAGGPLTLTVSGRATTLRFRDVLVGEVWVASGQSNMTLELARASRAEAAAATHEHLRLFTVPKTTTLEPVSSIAAAWQRCTPTTAGPFSAVAYYFGRRLHEELRVPVGMVHTSWPGSAAEEWTSPASLAADARLASIGEAWEKRRDGWIGGEGNPMAFDLHVTGIELVASAPGHPVLTLGPGTDTPWSFTWDEAPEMQYERRGGPSPVAWLHGEVRARDAGRLRIPVSSPAGSSLAAYDRLRLHVRGSGTFRVRALQPSIADGDDYAAQPVTATDEVREVIVELRSMRQAGWGVQKPFTPDAITAFEIEPLLGPAGARPPSGLFNAMVLPLVPYAIRGAIWYQGESNASRGRQYRALLPALIQSWRAAWGQGDFPFLIVQLPNYRDRSAVPQASGWAEVREAQAMTLRVPDTGLAVTIDVGEAIDIHPANKLPVGERLARWALGTTYGRPGVYSGPFFDAMMVEGGSARLRFRHTGAGLTTTDHRPLRGFAIAGDDQRFVWARAEIDGDSVVVSHPDVVRPVAVRYAWADNPDGNLGNADGLPASPFRTDDWER